MSLQALHACSLVHVLLRSEFYESMWVELVYG